MTQRISTTSPASKSHKAMRLWRGKPYPLGATWDGGGVNFAIFSENATKVELCLFDSPTAAEESYRIILPETTHGVWHGYLPDVRAGQLYGYRVYGPYAPGNGHRFNPKKIVLDPYAKGVGRRIKWHDSLFDYQMTASKKTKSKSAEKKPDEPHLVPDERDNAEWAPLAVVVDPAFTWEEDRPPKTPWNETVIYEMHVKGFTKLHPEIPQELRGTYAGLASDASVAHLKKLGITAVELMPIHHHVNDKYLTEKNLTNYWGYNTLSFFAPDIRYSSVKTPEETIREFKMMVKALHRAGIEVILDVVYNHTAEGNHFGPTLSFRGVDNASYYRLVEKHPTYYEDFTGCGNSLNMRHPNVLQLIMDSLRYWIQEMHVDGFRFDLASTLARELYEVDKLSSFFDVIQQDPVISQVKLIAEPWDLGAGGYQVGNFPGGWAEWNGKYRDSVRAYWKGEGGIISEIATRICGSSDLYAESGRQPHASINFVTCHDGFTLQDWVSYNQKHNEANMEDNRDGSDDNRSWNCGAEGPTEDPAILALREKQRRNLIATLFLSQGVPMINMGDEMGRTQQGNNNAYCQDNEISWCHWDLKAADKDFLEFVTHLVAFRKSQPTLTRRKFFQGRDIRGSGIKDIEWFEPSGQVMEDEAWGAHFVRCFGMQLAGDAMDEFDDRGERITGDTILILMNAHHEPIPFKLPDGHSKHKWLLVLSSDPQAKSDSCFNIGDPFDLSGRAVAVFKAVL